MRKYPHLPFFGVAVVASVFASSLAGCGSDQGPVSSPPLSFSGASLETVPTTSGQANIGLRWSPETPVKGSDAAELTFLDGAGAPLDGLTISIVPWMPAHGHGTSVQPVVTPMASGVFVATPLYLFMSGEWQLRMTITGALDDSAVVTVEIP